MKSKKITQLNNKELMLIQGGKAGPNGVKSAFTKYVKKIRKHVDDFLDGWNEA